MLSIVFRSNASHYRHVDNLAFDLVAIAEMRDRCAAGRGDGLQRIRFVNEFRRRRFARHALTSIATAALEPDGGRLADGVAFASIASTVPHAGSTRERYRIADFDERTDSIADTDGNSNSDGVTDTDADSFSHTLAS